MESIQGKTLAAVIIAAVAFSGIVGGAATYVLFPQIQTQTVDKPVYIDHYINQTVIEYRNNTIYVEVQPDYQGSDWFVQSDNITRALTHVQNLTYYVVTDWNDTRVTKLSGYRYDFICNGTHILANFTILGPANTLFGVGIIQTDKLGWWIWLGENYTNSAGEWTIVLRPVSVSQGWIYGAFGQRYNVGLSIVVNYNT